MAKKDGWIENQKSPNKLTVQTFHLFIILIMNLNILSFDNEPW